MCPINYNLRQKYILNLSWATTLATKLIIQKAFYTNVVLHTEHETVPMFKFELDLHLIYIVVCNTSVCYFTKPLTAWRGREKPNIVYYSSLYRNEIATLYGVRYIFDSRKLSIYTLYYICRPEINTHLGIKPRYVYKLDTFNYTCNRSL